MSTIIVQSIVFMFIFTIIPIVIFVIYNGLPLKKPMTFVKETSWMLKTMVLLVVGFPFLFLTLYANSPANEPALEGGRMIVNSMLKTDNGYVMVGTSRSSNRATIAKYDREGTLLWQTNNFEFSRSSYDTVSIDRYGDLRVTGQRIENLGEGHTVRVQRFESTYILSTGAQRSTETVIEDYPYNGYSYQTHANDRFTFTAENITEPGRQNQTYAITFDFDAYWRPWETISATHEFKTIGVGINPRLPFEKSYDMLYHDDEVTVLRMTFMLPSGTTALDYLLVLDDDMDILYKDDLMQRAPGLDPIIEAVTRYDDRTFILLNALKSGFAVLYEIEEDEVIRSRTVPWRDDFPDFIARSMKVHDSTLYIGGTRYKDSHFKDEPSGYQGLIITMDLDFSHQEVEERTYDVIQMREGLGVEAFRVESDGIYAIGTYYTDHFEHVESYHDLTTFFKIDANNRHTILAHP